jgi:hypothetical protein
MACYPSETMPRSSSVSVCLLLGAAGALLLGCDQGAATGASPTAGASNGGSSSSAGTNGVAAGGHDTTGGVTNLGGLGPNAGTSGTGTGGGSGCAGALFCDDFEAYNDTLGVPWTTYILNGTVGTTQIGCPP